MLEQCYEHDVVACTICFRDRVATRHTNDDHCALCYGPCGGQDPVSVRYFCGGCGLALTDHPVVPCSARPVEGPNIPVSKGEEMTDLLSYAVEHGVALRVGDHAVVSIKTMDGWIRFDMKSDLFGEPLDIICANIEYSQLLAIYHRIGDELMKAQARHVSADQS